MRRARIHRRGFTLVELMVAIATGLTVALAAFLLAKVSLGSFQQDARINNAQHSLLMAMNRVVADVKRAGFMVSPHAAADENVCQRINLGAVGQFLLATDLYEGRGGGNFYGQPAYGTAPNNTLPVVATGAENARAPDRLRLAGNYMTTERLTYRLVQGGNTAVLAVDTNAMQRVFRESPPGAPNPICRLFPQNRILRLVDGKQKETYAQITGCADNVAGGVLTGVQVTFAPFGSLPNVPGVCGVMDGNQGGTVNVVNVIEYSLQQVASPFAAADLAVHGLNQNMAPLVSYNPALTATTGEDTRMDLLRRELVWNGAAPAVVAGTGEVVAEWAADFKLRAWYAPAAGGTVLQDTGFDKNDAAGEPPAPQRIRSLGVRLSTRSREPDREARLNVVVPDSVTPLDRFEVFPTGTLRKNRMARVRTMYTDVSLPNLAQVKW